MKKRTRYIMWHRYLFLAGQETSLFLLSNEEKRIEEVNKAEFKQMHVQRQKRLRTLFHQYLIY